MYTVDVGDKQYKVVFGHYHAGTDGSKSKAITFCIINSNGHFVSDGLAACSWADNFSRSIGRKISLSRALKSAFDKKEVRRLFWENYFAARGGKTD